MGSTGHSLYGASRTGNLGTDTYGIDGAVVYRGRVPEDSGLEPVGANKITLKVPASDGNNILFQFRLSKDSRTMTTLAYKNGVPEVKCKVAVDSGQPSLDKVIAEGSKAQKIQATKMKDLFAKSTEIKENQLGSIADKLLENKRKREGDK